MLQYCSFIDYHVFALKEFSLLDKWHTELVFDDTLTITRSVGLIWN